MLGIQVWSSGGIEWWDRDRNRSLGGPPTSLFELHPALWRLGGRWDLAQDAAIPRVRLYKSEDDEWEPSFSAGTLQPCPVSDHLVLLFQAEIPRRGCSKSEGSGGSQALRPGACAAGLQRAPWGLRTGPLAC